MSWAVMAQLMILCLSAALAGNVQAAGQVESPIWPHSNTPAAHEVALFRHTFNLGEKAIAVRLHIFADTRYEVWLDGKWIGRGPARFSRTLRETDVYTLDNLAAGSHLVAVLVQWAPNNRRSESVTPFLKAKIEGTTANGGSFQVVSGAHWRAVLSNAWRADAAPVHSWGLIGPTELLDLRLLPANWNQPGFNDTGWSYAVVKDMTTPAYLAYQVPRIDLYDAQDPASSAIEPRPEWLVSGSSAPVSQPITFRDRSIPFLIRAPMAAALIEAGLLSPGYQMQELEQAGPATRQWTVTASQATQLILETLFGAVTPPATMQLDGRSLTWTAAGAARPDAYTFSVSLTAGTHRLTFTGIPALGATFNLSTTSVQIGGASFSQNAHAGRRVLLASPAPQPDVVEVSGASPFSLQFSRLPAYAVLDLGRTVLGRVEMQISGPAGTVVDIGWDERLAQDTHRPLPFPGSLHPQWDQVDSWILDGTTRTLTTLDARAGRYILVAAWGSGPVRLDSFLVYEERYPVLQIGSFDSPSPKLDKIWQVGVDTMFPTLSDAYADPWRERGQWWGDTFVQNQINQVAFGDTALYRRGIEYMANMMVDQPAPGLAPNNNGTHMLDYSMLWVQGLVDQYRQSGDAALISQTFPTVRKFMAHLASYENPTSHLIELPQAHWSQTVYIDPTSTYDRYGQSTAVNALYYRTLLDAAALAVLVNDSTSASAWQQKAATVKDSANRLLYLPAQHRYASNRYQGATGKPTPQAQAWALASGLVPDGEIQPVAGSLLSLLSKDPAKPNVETYGMYWVLDALGKSGNIPAAIQIIELHYGRMLDLGATTWWEGFNAYLTQWASLTHAWAGSPTWFLTHYVLGAEQVSPNVWAVKPAFEGVASASGILPLKDGKLEVAWQDSSCEQKSVDLKASAGSRGELVIPLSSPSLALTLNGEKVWENGAPLKSLATQGTDGIHLSLPAGNHHLDIQQVCIFNHLPLTAR